MKPAAKGGRSLPSPPCPAREGGRRRRTSGCGTCMAWPKTELRRRRPRAAPTRSDSHSGTRRLGLGLQQRGSELLGAAVRLHLAHDLVDLGLGVVAVVGAAAVAAVAAVRQLVTRRDRAPAASLQPQPRGAGSELGQVTARLPLKRAT